MCTKINWKQRIEFFVVVSKSWKYLSDDGFQKGFKEEKSRRFRTSWWSNLDSGQKIVDRESRQLRNSHLPLLAGPRSSLSPRGARHALYRLPRLFRPLSKLGSRAGRNVIASPRYFAAATKGSGHPRPRERGPTLARVDDSRENNATSRLEYFIARKRVFLAARALPRLLSPARVMPFSGRRGRRAFRQREPLFDARQRTG